MISLSGRALSRAWMAVQLAVSDDADRPALFRAVHVERYDIGVRLVATDSFWLARCWVPGIDEEFEDEPGLGVLPDETGTLRDEDWRVRDLMKHIAKLTKKEDAADVEVQLDLGARQYDEQVPTLSPELAPLRCSVEIPSRERVLATTVEVEYPNWRSLLLSFSASAGGASHTAMSGWMLDRLAKVARAVGAEAVSISWLDEQRARWGVDACVTEHRPSGVFMSAQPHRPPPTDPTLDDDDSDNPQGD